MTAMVVSGVRREAVLRVLGPLLAGPTGSESHLQAARQRTILTLLAVATASRRSLTPEDLIAGAYDGEDTAKVRRSLSTEIWRSRQLLGKDGISSGPDGYRIDTERVAVDAVDFLEQLELGRAALEDEEYGEAESLMTQALALWRGAPLPDVRDRPEVQAFQARLEELRTGAEEDHAEALAGLGRHREAITLLERVLAEHPDREHACALLVTSYTAIGDGRRAGRALDVARRALADYGVEPGAELQAAREALVPRPRSPERPGLVGRDAELADLVQLGAAALHDARTAAAVVTGEAGIGKTTLVQHAAAALAIADGARNTIERVVCDRRLGLPYAALAPVLDRLRARTGTPLPMTISPDALVNDAVDVLETAADVLGGLVLVVEDLQWATPEVLEVLLLLVARQSATPLAVLATVRDPAPMPGPVAGAIGELRRRSGSVIRLQGLDERAAGRLLGTDTDATREALRLTGGNPLYLRHLGAPGSQGRPASLGDALDEHIDALPEAGLRVLTAAALIGIEFDRRVLTSALVHPPLSVAPSEVDDALRGATDAGIVVPHDEQRAGFVHGLLHDRLLARAPAADRMTLHTLIAGALERLAPLAGGVSAEVLAHHSLRGWPQCPTDEVVARLSAAGREASRQAADAAAQGYYRQALDLIAMDPEYADDDEVGALLTACGQAAVAAADAPAARSAYGLLREHGERVQRPEFRLRGSLGILQTYSTGRVDDRALDDLEAAVREAVDVEELPGDLLPECVAALHVYRVDRARRLADAAVERSPRLAPRVLARLWDQEVPRRQVAITEHLERCDDPDPLTLRVRQQASGVAAGVRSLDEAHVGWSAEEGSEDSRWMALLWQICTANATGRFARAHRLLDVASEQVPQGSTDLAVVHRRSNVNGLRAWLAVLQLDAAGVAAGMGDVHPGWNVQRPLNRVLSAYTLGLRGSTVDALNACDELVDEFLDGVAPGRHQPSAMVALGSGAVNLGHRRGIALAAELLEQHRGEHVLHFVVHYMGAVEYHLARFAVARGDLDTALEEYDVALAAHARSGSRVFEALTLRAIAAVLHHRDRGTDRSDALGFDARAAALGAEIGMPQLTRGAWPPRGPLDLGGPYGPAGSVSD